MDSKVLLQRFLVGMRDHLGIQKEEHQSILKKLVATSWKAFAGDIAVRSGDAIEIHQDR